MENEITIDFNKHKHKDNALYETLKLYFGTYNINAKLSITYGCIKLSIPGDDKFLHCHTIYNLLKNQDDNITLKDINIDNDNLYISIFF